MQKELRKFAFLWGFIFLGIGGYFFFLRNADLHSLLFGIGFLFFIIGLLFPQIIKPFYSFWIKLGYILGWVNTRIILAFLFFLIITPIGLVGRLFGQDLLRKKIDKKTKSYWIEREEQPHSMKYPF